MAADHSACCTLKPMPPRPHPTSKPGLASLAAVKAEGHKPTGQQQRGAEHGAGSSDGALVEGSLTCNSSSLNSSNIWHQHVKKSNSFPAKWWTHGKNSCNKNAWLLFTKFLTSGECWVKRMWKVTEEKSWTLWPSLAALKHSCLQITQPCFSTLRSIYDSLAPLEMPLSDTSNDTEAIDLRSTLWQWVGQ